MSHVVEINALHTKNNFNEINTVVPPPLLMLEATSGNYCWRITSGADVSISFPAKCLAPELIMAAMNPVTI